MGEERIGMVEGERVRALDLVGAEDRAQAWREAAARERGAWLQAIELSIVSWLRLSRHRDESGQRVDQHPEHNRFSAYHCPPPSWPSRSNEPISYGKKESPLAPKEGGVSNV